MSYNVKTTDVFEKQAKRLYKKYVSLKVEVWELVQQIKEHPDQGKALGKNCYKLRLGIKSKGKGKRGGARLITNFVVVNDAVYLLSIYDKSEKQNLTNKELEELLEHIPDQ